MSTKTTLILTDDNEHWYVDCNGRSYENTDTEDCLVLEFDSRHRVEENKDGTRIIIESDTPLYKMITEFMANTKRLIRRIEDLEAALGYAIKAADGWYDDCRGGDIETEEMEKAKELIEYKKNK